MSRGAFPISVLVVASAAIFHVARAQDAVSNPVAETLTEAEQLAEYWDHVAVNNTAAEAWKRANRPTPAGVAGDLSAHEALIASNYGCPDGTQFWQRDRVTDLCARLCTSDLDCGPEDGRCRVIDFGARAHDLEIALVDDLADEEIAAWMEPTDPLTPPMQLCDPFFDVEGALDGDVSLENE